MLRLLIPVTNKNGALQAARHAAFLFAERCVSEVELVQVLEPFDEGRAAAFHSLATLRLHEERMMSKAMTQTRAILDDAGVPYHWTRVVGPVVETIAARAAEKQSDVVLLDASRLSFITRWWLMARLWRNVQTPVTVLH
jgi:nucleotide-binding universal stress UspA family protein